MHNPQVPSDKALLPFVSVENMMQLVHSIGIETMLCELTDEIETDFKRWELFDKTPRVASHSGEGVIELMPTSDGEVYAFFVTGQAAGRRDERQITLFDSVGFAIEDFSALRYVRRKLSDTDLYQNLDIIADPDDPRDLFGMLQRAK